MNTLLGFGPRPSGLKPDVLPIKLRCFWSTGHLARFGGFRWLRYSPPYYALLLFSPPASSLRCGFSSFPLRSLAPVTLSPAIGGHLFSLRDKGVHSRPPRATVARLTGESMFPQRGGRDCLVEYAGRGRFTPARGWQHFATPPDPAAEEIPPPGLQPLPGRG